MFQFQLQYRYYQISFKFMNKRQSNKLQRPKTLINAQTKLIIAICSLIDFGNLSISQALFKANSSSQKQEYINKNTTQTAYLSNQSKYTKRSKGKIFQKSHQNSAKLIQSFKQLENSKGKTQLSPKRNKIFQSGDKARLVSQFLQFDSQKIQQTRQLQKQNHNLANSQRNKLCVSFGRKNKQSNALLDTNNAIDKLYLNRTTQDYRFDQQMLGRFQDSKQQVLQQFDCPITQLQNKKETEPIFLISSLERKKIKQNQHFKTFQKSDVNRIAKERLQIKDQILPVKKQKITKISKDIIQPESRVKIGSNNSYQSIRQSNYIQQDNKRSSFRGQQTSRRRSSVKSIDISSHIKGHNKSKIKQQIISKNNLTQMNRKKQLKTQSEENSYVNMYESKASFNQNVAKANHTLQFSPRKKIFNDKKDAQTKSKSKEIKDSIYSGFSPSKPISVSIYLPSLPPKQQLLYQSPKQKKFIREISGDIKNLIKKIQTTQSIQSKSQDYNGYDFKSRRLIRVAKNLRND